MPVLFESRDAGADGHLSRAELEAHVVRAAVARWGLAGRWPEPGRMAA